jgi:hypothetical protein
MFFMWGHVVRLTKAMVVMGPEAAAGFSPSSRIFISVVESDMLQHYAGRQPHAPRKLHGMGFFKTCKELATTLIFTTLRQ